MFGPCTLLVETNPDDKFLVVTYMGNAEPSFKVKSCNTPIHCKREVFEVLGEIEFPLFMLQKQIATLHARCDAYGTSCNDTRTFEKKLFTISKTDIQQDRTNLNVKLLNTFKDMRPSVEIEEHKALVKDLKNKGFSSENKTLIADLLQKVVYLEKGKDKCNIIGSWSKKNFTINKPGHSIAIAEVLPHGPHATNDKFEVDVSSKVDCAFVISLIAAIDCMKDPGTLKSAGKAVGFVMKAAAGAAFAAGGSAGCGFVLS